MSEAEKYGLTEKYWKGLSDKSRELYRAIRPLRTATYAVDHHLMNLKAALEGYKRDAEEMGATFDLNPDFQRGHVWTRDKQIGYVEALLRGTAPKVLRFNSPAFADGAVDGDIKRGDFVCVDGLQRLTALLAFMDGEFPVFGRYYAEDLRSSPFDPHRMNQTVRFEIFAIKNRVDLLQFYLDINAGGVVHSEEELARVRGLLEEAKK